ncbi:putative uncharacterized protein DDB_G0283051 [Anastrepha ludens]|uniref:putative uncharacterized protein DDB_G0283051 n=1 Tax=Anastrepha ludens TaxID=28586 RepID=UPI0023B0A3D7|nr:putative uncharacterized protein DDB_G0283051 [Anastrepha ludens]
MELAICKTELATTRFMLPTAPASFYQKNSAHFSEILNFNTNYLLNKNNPINCSSSSSGTQNNNSNSQNNSVCVSASASSSQVNNNQNISVNNNNNNNSVSSNSDSCNNNSVSGSGSMRLKKNRRVTFLKNLIETNIRIKEEPDDGSKDIPPPMCSLSDMSDHEASIGEYNNEWRILDF